MECGQWLFGWVQGKGWDSGQAEKLCSNYSNLCYLGINTGILGRKGSLDCLMTCSSFLGKTSKSKPPMNESKILVPADKFHTTKEETCIVILEKGKFCFLPFCLSLYVFSYPHYEAGNLIGRSLEERILFKEMQL